MTRSEICQALESNYKNFVEYLDYLTIDEFEFAPEGKWTAGMQATHLIKSTDPIISAFDMPKFILKTKFGLAKRPSRDYPEITEEYMQKLEDGGKAGPKYIPKKFKIENREKTSKQLLQNIEKICERVPKWPKEDLDKYVLPHPLLGKITMREMLYFTIHHAPHHQMLIKKYLKGI